MLYNDAQQICAFFNSILKGKLVPHFPVLHFQSCIFRSCIFSRPIPSSSPGQVALCLSSLVGVRHHLRQTAHRSMRPSRCSARHGNSEPTPTQLAQDADETLFEKIRYNHGHLVIALTTCPWVQRASCPARVPSRPQQSQLQSSTSTSQLHLVYKN